MNLSLSEKYKLCFKDRKFIFSVIGGFLFLATSIVIAFFAIMYATESASQPVTDIILNNIPLFDVDGLFIYGPLVFWFIIFVYLIFEPKKIPFSLNSIALFTLIRSAAISLTHIGPFMGNVQISSLGVLGVFTSGNDLFFSGHTGLPFLMALILWDKKPMRYFCLAASVFFGAVVLMARLHYSIDVFAAFFITYTIFKITEKLFKKIKKHFSRPFKSFPRAPRFFSLFSGSRR
ncbi:MAG: phosphatase PAP2-related protein [Minisyncoccia bacterium]